MAILYDSYISMNNPVLMLLLFWHFYLAFNFIYLSPYYMVQVWGQFVTFSLR